MSAAKINNYTCNICGAKSKVLGFKREIIAAACPLCGFIWKDKNSIPRDYKEPWESGLWNTDGVRNDYKVYDYRLKALQENRRGPLKKIMDFGCGPGRFVTFLREKGYDSYGCDPGEEFPAVPYFYKSDISAVDAHDFDAIISIEAFEHVEDIKTVMTEIVKRLRKGGLLYVQTNYTHVDSVLGWGYFDFEGHVSFYNPKAMRILMDHAGLELIHFDNRKQTKNVLWFARKFIHLAHKIIPPSLQKASLSKTAAHLVTETAKFFFGKKLDVQPPKDYVSSVLEVSNCVFIGIKR